MPSVLLRWPVQPAPHVRVERRSGGVRMEHELTNEAELIRRMLAGEERAFQAFFESHFPRLYRFALPARRP